MIFVNNFDPVLLEFGSLQVRWYGLCFVVGLSLGYLVIRWAFKKEGLKMEDLESVAFYLFVGLIVGARLGHVLFYDFNYFWRHPLEILMIWNGGLASHGAAIGLLIAYLLWLKIHKKKFVQYIDALVLGFPLVAGFVRIGNFFNSEIVGYKTGGDYGVVFARLGEDFARHPAQLYESLLSFTIFAVMIFVYVNYRDRLKPLFFVFLYMGLYFGGRFFLEYTKDLHVFSSDFPLSMGQVLSILPVLLTVGYAIYYPKISKR
ncbi:prolipoprotein diacylglyceryl transferase [Patescibacteria group bacterium]|nr:prolipoprotein diacylglyceryl transferase [Patescibacteria group bacterium]